MQFVRRTAIASLGLFFAAALSLPGCGKGVPGLQDFRAGVAKKRLYVSFVSTTLQWDYGVSAPIPGLPDSLVSIAPDLNSSGIIFQFAIGLETILNQGKPFPLSGLPDGRPIPDVRAGMLPRWDTDIRSLKLSVYLADDAFALFVPLDFVSKKGQTLSYPISIKIEDERGNILGKAYAIPQNPNGTGSGLLVLLPFVVPSVPTPLVQ